MLKHPRYASLWIAAVMILAAPLTQAEVLDRTMNAGDTTVHYKVVLPDHYDTGKAYPGVLGFGGGPQTMDVVNGLIARYFRDQAEKRGYIVVVPAAPNNKLFFQGGERIFPEFLNQILATYKIQGDKFHIAGQSNGGISAFYIASLYPQYFLSITAFPGFLPDASAQRVQAIAKMCVNMFVGELDPMGWQDMMSAQASQFRASGMSAQYTVEKGQPHRLETLAGANAHRLFDLFEQAQHGCAK